MKNYYPNHEEIRVYVGTYHQFNNGSYYGAWLTLNNYKTPADFWEACKQLHKAEHDPEFMFQDREAPDMLRHCISESYIDTQEIWYGYFASTPEAETMPETAEYSKEQLQAWKKAFIEKRIRDEYGESNDKAVQSWRKWYNGHYLACLPINGVYFLVEKGSIQTDFCYGHGQNGISTAEEEESASEAAEAIRQESAWLAENLDGIQEKIDILQGRYRRSYGRFYPYVYEHRNALQVTWSQSWEPPYIGADITARKPTEEEKRVMLLGYSMQHDNLEKRCKTWWKRYGAEKLHTWTYLVD